MSYILEALKKSQQERELGNVPKLQAVSFDDEPAHAPTHRWVYAALLLAVAAVAMALFAVLRDAPDASESATVAGVAPGRGGGDSPLPSVDSELGAAVDVARRDVQPPVRSSSQASAHAALPPGSPVQEGSPLPPDPSAQATAAPELIAAAAPAPKPTQTLPPQRLMQPPALVAPESMSVQPEVLVVPAPPKPGQPLPRGADELRRAVLGPDSSPSIDATTPLPSPPAPTATDQAPEHVPVPADLIADIEAFKKQVGSAPAAARADARPVLPPPPPAVPTADSDIALPPPPSLALRGKLPEFRMSVHIYDAEPSRRFVYINGRKLRENDKSREGLRLERIVADGAVLSYQGESFFQPR